LSRNCAANDSDIALEIEAGTCYAEVIVASVGSRKPTQLVAANTTQHVVLLGGRQRVNLNEALGIKV